MSTPATFVTVEERHRSAWKPALEVATQKINAVVGGFTRRTPYLHIETSHPLLYDALLCLSSIGHKMYTDIRESNPEYAPLCFASEGRSLDVKDIHARAITDLKILQGFKLRIDATYPPIRLGETELSEADTITFNCQNLFNDTVKLIEGITKTMYSAYKLESPTTFTFSRTFSFSLRGVIDSRGLDREPELGHHLHSVTSPCGSFSDDAPQVTSGSLTPRYDTVRSLVKTKPAISSSIVVPEQIERRASIPAG